MTRNTTILTTTILLLSFAVLVVGIIDQEAFAISAGPEYEPTQPNALVSYDSTTNQVIVTWDFNTLPDDAKCFLKTDMYYKENILDFVTQSDYVRSFTPDFYSATSNTPIIYERIVGNPNDHAEVISCTDGNTKIDIDTIMSHSENPKNYPDLEIFMSFYLANDDGTFNTDDSNRIDEVMVSYTPIRDFDQNYKDYACGGQIGNVLYIDSSRSNCHFRNLTPALWGYE